MLRSDIVDITGGGIILINSRKKRIGVVIVTITLSLILLAGTGFGIAYYQNYYEKAIPMEKLLDYPDDITVYYNDGERVRSKQLQKSNIAEAYAGFEELREKYVAKGDADLRTLRWTEEWFLEKRAIYGAVEFHYDQRREINLAISPPNPDPLHPTEDMYFMSGVADSVTLLFYPDNCISVAYCLNGQYSGKRSSYSQFGEGAIAHFQSILMQCVQN